MLLIGIPIVTGLIYVVSARSDLNSLVAETGGQVSGEPESLLAALEQLNPKGAAHEPA